MKIASKLPLQYAYPSQVKQKLAWAHAEFLRHGYLTNVTYSLTQEGEEKVTYDFATQKAQSNSHTALDDSTAYQLVLDFYRQLTGTGTLSSTPTVKELALAIDYLSTYGPACAAFIIRHTLEAVKKAQFPNPEIRWDEKLSPLGTHCMGKIYRYGNSTGSGAGKSGTRGIPPTARETSCCDRLALARGAGGVGKRGQGATGYPRK